MQYEIRVCRLLRTWITCRVVFPQIDNFNGIVQTPRSNQGERERRGIGRGTHLERDRTMDMCIHIYI